jgi:hypothetical protein
MSKSPEIKALLKVIDDRINNLKEEIAGDLKAFDNIQGMALNRVIDMLMASERPYKDDPALGDQRQKWAEWGKLIKSKLETIKALEYVKKELEEDSRLERGVQEALEPFFREFRPPPLG